MNKWLKALVHKNNFCLAAILFVILSCQPAIGSDPKDQQQIIKLAKTDPIAILTLCKDHYQKNITDYTGTLRKQERIAGKLGAEQLISFKFKEDPFSVFMQWQKNPGPSDRLLYVEGQNDNKMIVHPTGFLSWIKSVKRDPRCKKALQTNLNTCDRFGFARIIDRVLNTLQKAQKQNDIKVKYLGLDKAGSRQCLAIEAILKQKPDYPFTRMILRIDLDYLLPVYIETYLDNGDLRSRYIYTDLKFNTNLTNNDFTPQVNNL